MVERVCANCGNTYRTVPSEKKRYCSMECLGQHRKRGDDVACEVCAKIFYRHRSKPDRRYCSRSCRTTARNLTSDNPAKHRDISGAKNPMFGKGMVGEANPMFGKRRELAPRWKGGRKIRRDGYILCVAPDDHPYPCYVKPSGLKYVLEHRLVMEKMIGRYLDPDEIVHHRDENRSNNSEGNLLLLPSQSDHARLHRQP